MIRTPNPRSGSVWYFVRMGPGSFTRQALVPWADSCVLYQHVDLTDDLAVAHLERRFDQHTTAVRVLATFPKLYPPLVHGDPLDAVRGPLTVDSPQVLG